MHAVLPPHREEGGPSVSGPVLHGGMGTVMIATLMEAAHGDLTEARLLISSLQAAAYDGRIEDLLKSRYVPGQKVN